MTHSLQKAVIVIAMRVCRRPYTHFVVIDSVGGLLVLQGSSEISQEGLHSSHQMVTRGEQEGGETNLSEKDVANH